MFYINKFIINMENNDKLKDINIKNCIYYYFDDIIKIEDIYFNNIFLHEKW